jgi:RimJ/RimL family protein N-acetyltransferase
MIKSVLDPAAAATQMALVADSAAIEIRPMIPDDREALVHLFAEMSPVSRYRRFFCAKQELTRLELDHLTNVDHVRHEAIVAVDRGHNALIGVARYIVDESRPSEAEFAIAVADAWHGMGVGTAIAEELLARARKCGLTLLTAFTLRYNPQAQALLCRLGFRLAQPISPTSELSWELRLQERPRSSAGSADDRAILPASSPHGQQLRVVSHEHVPQGHRPDSSEALERRVDNVEIALPHGAPICRDAPSGRRWRPDANQERGEHRVGTRD